MVLSRSKGQIFSSEKQKAELCLCFLWSSPAARWTSQSGSLIIPSMQINLSGELGWGNAKGSSLSDQIPRVIIWQGKSWRTLKDVLTIPVHKREKKKVCKSGLNSPLFSVISVVLGTNGPNYRVQTSITWQTNPSPKGSRVASVVPGMQSFAFDMTFVSTATSWEITIGDINYIGRNAMTNNSSLQIKTQKGMKRKYHSICKDKHWIVRYRAELKVSSGLQLHISQLLLY